MKLAALGTGAAVAYPAASAPAPPVSQTPAGTSDRDDWCAIAQRLARPVLEALAHRRLKATMPVDPMGDTHNASRQGRVRFQYLEALGRLLCGLAPWFELAPDGSTESLLRSHFAELARQSIDAATDPASPDFMNFSQGGQPLVDAAFLAQAMLRAPDELWSKLPARVQSNVIAALESSRGLQPGENNWKLFATTIEVFLQKAGGRRDDARLFDGLRAFQHWYAGDGLYGDGPEFHFDYYNSFVIHPMLLEGLEAVAPEAPQWAAFRDRERLRLTRWAAIQERLIAPDGSFPVVGRSIVYRCGAFQGLALAALRHLLPATLPPGQARRALSSAIRRTLNASNTWDRQGWLSIGLAGHQPELAEIYISAGSPYLCSAALLPLGLPPADPFWTAPAEKTTWERAWSGGQLPPDHALSTG